MLFSIVTITFNNLKGFQRTHRSMQEQDCADYEWIIVDGASTDGTADYIKELNVHIISEPDKGLYDAMNKGIDHAKGKYIVFMNSGDEFASPSTLSDIKAAIDKHSSSPDFIYGDALETGEYENSDGKPLYKPARSHEHPERGLFTHHQAMYYAREKISDLRYDLSYPIAADYKFTAQFLMNCNDVFYIPSALCLYESGGISQTGAAKGRKEQFRIKKELKIAPLYKILLIYLTQAMAQNLRSLCPDLYWRIRSLR